MSQGVIIALLVLAGLLVLRVSNLPPFSGSTTQSPTPGQTLPTPITRSTGFSTGVASASENTSIAPNPTQSPAIPTQAGSGAPTASGATPQPPVRAKW